MSNKKTYNFIYDDGKYMTLDLTEEDIDKLKGYVIRDETFAVLSIGVVSLNGLRFAVERIEDEPTKELAAEIPPEYDLMMLMDKQARRSNFDDDDDTAFAYFEDEQGV